jgi:hypothetical protein
MFEERYKKFKFVLRGVRAFKAASIRERKKERKKVALNEL